MTFGWIEHETLLRSIRLMGEEVIPVLCEVQPPAQFPAQLLDEPVITNEELQASRLGRAPRYLASKRPEAGLVYGSHARLSH